MTIVEPLVWVDSYSAGFRDGLEEVLDHLEGIATVAPAGNYTGPMPEELAAWIAQLRRRGEES